MLYSTALALGFLNTVVSVLVLSFLAIFFDVFLESCNIGFSLCRWCFFWDVCKRDRFLMGFRSGLFAAVLFSLQKQRGSGQGQASSQR